MLITHQFSLDRAEITRVAYDLHPFVVRSDTLEYLQGVVGAAVVHEDMLIVVPALQSLFENIPDRLVDLLDGQCLVKDTRYD